MSRPKQFFKTNFSQILLLLAIFLAGWSLGSTGIGLNIGLNPPSLKIVNKTATTSTIDFSLFWEVLDRINTDFLFKPLDGQELLYGAISGLVKALGDPYSSFLTAEQNAEFKQSLEGKYEGIGAELDVRDGQLMVVAPLDGSPAEAAGVRAGDKIVEIEGVSTKSITVTEAVMKIRGEAGTVSTLTLKRGKGKPFVVEITRAEIALESVRYEELNSSGEEQAAGGFFYIRVSRFGENTLAEWDAAAKAIKAKEIGSKGIILDLRSNPGGLLNASVYLASEFITKGTIVIQELADGSRQSLKATSTANDHAFKDMPVVVLVNEGSASASEILAGALKEKTEAKLVGKQTFGKGTVQDAEDLAGGAGLHLTVAKWLTPKGNWVHEKGLTPDYEVEMTEEDIEADRDPQLDKALELLK